jgi:hypothetical protein
MTASPWTVAQGNIAPVVMNSGVEEWTATERRGVIGRTFPADQHYISLIKSPLIWDRQETTR